MTVFPGPTLGVGHHLLNREVEGPIGVRDAAEALEPDRRGSRVLPFHLGLNVDVGKDAMGQRVFQAEHLQDFSQCALNGGDRSDFARDRMSDQVADARVRQQGTGPGSRPVIPCGHTDGPVSFLEFVGGPQQLPVERRVVPAFRTSDVGEDAFVVIGGGTCGAGLADRSGAPSQDPE